MQEDKKDIEIKQLSMAVFEQAKVISHLSQRVKELEKALGRF